MKKMNKKGFTIVELVIVIAVIAILAGVLIPTFGGIVDKANISAREQEAAAAYKDAYAVALSNDGVVNAADNKETFDINNTPSDDTDDIKGIEADGIIFTFANDGSVTVNASGNANFNGYNVSVNNGVVTVTK